MCRSWTLWSVSARNERGQALVEFALTLPLLVFGLLGAADLARAFSVQLAVQNAARAGVEAEAIGVASGQAEVTAFVHSELARVPGLRPEDATVTVSKTTSGSAKYVEVNVRYTFRTVVPWPLVPNATTLDRSTTMRDFK